MEVIIITIWLFMIVLYSVRVISGWPYFFKARKAVWARRMKEISHAELQGIRMYGCKQGKCKPPITWFRNKLLLVTFFVVPFNLVGLNWYSKIGLGFERLYESEPTLLIMVLLVAWVVGFAINGQGLEAENLLRISKEQYLIESAWLNSPAQVLASEEEGVSK